MLPEHIATRLGVPVQLIERLLSLSAASVLEDAEYIEYLKKFDLTLLENSLDAARSAYEVGLPAFKQEIEARYQITAAPMSAFTLGNWVVGALQYPEHTQQILVMHSRVPGRVIVEGLDSLVAMLDDLPEGRDEWQRALVALAIPLMRI
ncbi:MAG: hypothetical protein ACOYL5_09415 [Phototrophicaceae bacterium]